MGNTSIKLTKNLNGYTFKKKTIGPNIRTYITPDCSKIVIIEDRFNELHNFIFGQCKIIVTIFDIDTLETKTINFKVMPCDFKHGIEGD